MEYCIHVFTLPDISNLLDFISWILGINLFTEEDGKHSKINHCRELLAGENYSWFLVLLEIRIVVLPLSLKNIVYLSSAVDKVPYT